MGGVGYGSAVTAPASPPAAPGPWTYLARYRGQLLGGVAMLLVTNAMFLGIPVTTGKVVAALGHGDPDGDVPLLCALMVGFALVTAVSRIWSRVWIFNAARAAEYDLRGDLFHHLLGLDGLYHASHPTGDTMSRLTNDVQTVRAMWGAGVLNIVNTAFAFATVLTMMIRIDPTLTLIACLPYPTIVIAGRLFGKRIYKASIGVQAQLGALAARDHDQQAAEREHQQEGLDEVFGGPVLVPQREQDRRQQGQRHDQLHIADRAQRLCVTHRRVRREEVVHRVADYGSARYGLEPLVRALPQRLRVASCRRRVPPPVRVEPLVHQARHPGGRADGRQSVRVQDLPRRRGDAHPRAAPRGGPRRSAPRAA